MKRIIIILLLLASVSIGQVCQDVESDTATYGDYLSWLRFRLNDYHSTKTWVDSVLYSFIYQSAWQFKPEKRDTVVVGTGQYYTLNSDYCEMRGVSIKNDGRWSNMIMADSTGNGAIVKIDTVVLGGEVITVQLAGDFKQLHGLFVKNAGRWSEMLKPDSTGLGQLIKQDTIVTNYDTMMYALNTDFLRCLGVIIKRNGNSRWSTLYQRSVLGAVSADSLWGRAGNPDNVQYYTVMDKYLLLDPPAPQGDDSLIVFYSAFEFEVQDRRLLLPKPIASDSLIVVYKAFEYQVSDKRLFIGAPNSGDSLIVFYKAYPNAYSASSTILNIPYVFREQLLARAYELAVRANQH